MARRRIPTHYPGSPVIAQRIAREADELRLFELHPGEGEALSACVAGDHRTRVLREDGFRGALGQLPPPSRRGLVLVDPPYEIKSDFEAVVRRPLRIAASQPGRLPSGIRSWSGHASIISTTRCAGAAFPISCTRKRQ